MPEPIWCWCVLKLTAQLTKNKTKPFGCLQELSGEDTDQIFAHSFLVLPSAVILQIIIKYDDSSKKTGFESNAACEFYSVYNSSVMCNFQMEF